MTKKKVYMTREVSANYLKIGLALCGMCISEQTSDLIINLHGEILKKEGRFNIHDAVRIKLDNERYYKEIELSKIQDKNGKDNIS